VRIRHQPDGLLFHRPPSRAGKIEAQKASPATARTFTIRLPLQAPNAPSRRPTKPFFCKKALLNENLWEKSSSPAGVIFWIGKNFRRKLPGSAGFFHVGVLVKETGPAGRQRSPAKKKCAGTWVLIVRGMIFLRITNAIEPARNFSVSFSKEIYDRRKK